MKKFLATVLVFAMAFTMATTAFATSGTSSGTVGYGDAQTIVQTLSDGTVVKTTIYPTTANGVQMKSVETTVNKSTTATFTVSVPVAQGEVKVVVPVKSATSTTVLVRTLSDGTQEIVRDCYATEDGIAFTAKGEEKLTVVDNKKEFADEIPAWAAEGINFVTSRELFLGYENKSFGSQTNMTRAMLLTVLARLEGAKVKTTGKNWADESVAWAVKQGISDGTNSEANITREQMVVMMHRNAGSPAVACDLSIFADADSVSSWAVAAMQWAVKTGIINGINGKLEPQKSATRAEVAVILERFCKS